MNPTDIFCEQPAGKNHCPWNDNGYCHYYDELERKKRLLLARSNDLFALQPVCRQDYQERGSK
jgi:hypothetical protein